MRSVLLLVLLFNFLFAKIDQQQIQILNTVYNICKQYPANDGFTFENTCAAIALTETSAGKQLIGDQGEHPDILVNSSLGIMQVRVRTALEVLKNFSEIKQRYIYFWHEDINAIEKYVPILKNISYYKTQMRRFKSINIEKYKFYRKKYLSEKKRFEKYKKVYFKDLQLAEALLSDLKFNIMIAVHYLILNYEVAKQRKYWNPWWKAISRYNGGWNNKKYVQRVLKNMKIIKKLKENQLLGI